MNEHVKNAAEYQNVGRLDMAKIEATLALAYEQRTANLIALLDLRARTGQPNKALHEHVNERLGLVD